MTLNEIASFIKSANAGASMLTFEVGFDHADQYARVVAARVVTPESVAPLYGLRPEQVKVYDYRPSLVIKISIPRPSLSGGLDERDFDGVQQFAPLLDMPVPD